MPEITASKYLTQASWRDVPHLPPEAQAALLSGYSPHERKARSEGAPSLGSGAIYPVDPDSFRIDPLVLPDHWPRVYALDVGWKRTAALWAAHDRQNDVVYLYSEYYQAEALPAVHVAAIKARGAWIPGVIDPASAGASQRDGNRLAAEYRSLGLKLVAANNDVEAGILAVLDRLSTGRLLVFRTLQNWFREHALYRRDEKGRVVKEFDHLMDAMRYLVLSGLEKAITRPATSVMAPNRPAADAIAGY